MAELGHRCPHQQTRNVVKALGWFCGRYNLHPRPEHSTETSVVHLATELTSDNLSGRHVAIKFMSEQAQYESEIKFRKDLDTRFWRTPYNPTLTLDLALSFSNTIPALTTALSGLWWESLNTAAAKPLVQSLLATQDGSTSAVTRMAS